MANATTKKSPPRLEKICQTLLEHTSISMTDNYGNIVYVSKAFCNQCGYSEEELLGKNHSLLKSNKHSESFYTFLWSTISAGNSWKGEICNVNKKGEHYWIECQIIPLLDEDNYPEYFVALSSDITHQKSLLKKLKARAQQQGLIAILGQLSINAADIDSYIQQSLTAITGSLEMTMGMVFELSDDNSLARIVASTSPQTTEAVPVLASNILGYTLEQDSAVITRNINTQRNYEYPEFLSGGPWHAALGLCIGDRDHRYGIMLLMSELKKDLTFDDVHFAQSICNLISETVIRHGIETKLIESRALTRKYLDVADIVIIVIGEDGKIRLVNQKASALLGLEQEDLIGLNWFDYFIPYNEREKVRQDFNKLLHGEPVDPVSPEQGYQSLIITRSAKTRLVRWHNAVIHDEARGDLSLLCAGEDVTEIVQARKEKEKLLGELYQAQKMEALGVLASGIAHNFNNILSSILGYTELAIENFAAGNSKLAGYLDHIQTSSGKARDIIEQMQNYNRPDQSEFAPAMLPSLIGNIIKMMRAAVPSSIIFEQELDVDVPAITTNPSQLNELVLLLIINARNILDNKGRIKISIAECKSGRRTCASCGKDFSGHLVELVVADSGPEIDSARLGEMFGTDNQPLAEPETVNGSLAGIHRIAHQLGAHILVDSGDDGNRFRILFPVACDSVLKLQPRFDAGTKIAPPHPDWRIMIVDDDPSVAGFLGEVFNQYGLRNSVYTDPYHALHVFTENPQVYSLVITDQNMPLLNGEELAGKMVEQRPDIPVVLCTGYDDRIDKAHGADMKIKALLSKPVQIQELLETVHRLLEPEKAESA